jgi:5-methylcytosine-specific restriction endonuclease McrA
MSQVAPAMHREPVVPEPRKQLTKAQRREILERQHDCCGECGNSLIWQVVDGQKVYAPMIDEHVKRLFIGGSNELNNRQLWCVGCSKAKTRAEAPENAKIRRLLADQEDDAAPQHRWQSRGFDQRLTKGFNGQVRPRKQRTKASQTRLASVGGSESRAERAERPEYTSSNPPEEQA